MEIEDDILIVDRSTLERYATCPRQGRFYDLHKPTPNVEMVSGIEAHQVLSQVVAYFDETWQDATAGDLKEQIMREAFMSRPDVQADVVDALKYSAWAIADYLAKLPAGALMRFDGGKGSKSGQLAHDIHSVRITSECDLLHATAAKEVVQLIDWKSGHKHWTEADVRDAFQFQMLTYLIWENYPDVQCVRVSIWNTRSNSKTYSVEFTRDKHYEQISGRVRRAASIYVANHEEAIEYADAWPMAGKCEQCDFAADCAAIQGVANNESLVQLLTPKELLAELHIIDKARDQIAAALAAHVQKAGSDVIDEETGLCFGIGKPKQTRKPTMELYERK